MKLILKSNFDDDTVAEKLLFENVPESDASIRAEHWNKAFASEYSKYYCVPKPDDYVLWRGMADLAGLE